MTKQEFIERTLLQVTDDEFVKIHELYMAFPYDKDIFCDLYKSTNDSGKELLIGIQSAAASDRRTICNQKTIIDELEKKIQVAAQAFVVLSSEATDGSDRDKSLNEARKLIGKRGVIKMKIKIGAVLSNDEKETIINSL